MADDPSIIFTALTANPDGQKPRQALDEYWAISLLSNEKPKK